jgi:nucleotide-binding universal stress UspA family protein
MYRILVPLDGSQRAERAIPWADELAGALSAEVQLLSIVEPRPLPGIPMGEGVIEEVVESEIAAARAALDWEAGLFTHAHPTRREVTVGLPGEAITGLAQARGVALIVMSSHGRGEFQRAFLGSVADEVIRESRLPVLVIRDTVPSPPDHAPRTILVPLDGSELSEAVLTHVKPLARALRARLILFWQVDLPPRNLPIQGTLIPLSTVAASGRSDMVDYLEGTAAGLQADGIQADVRVWFGTRAESIVRFAEEERVDLIAMSTHGRHGFGRWLRGSTADYVLRHATVPVLTVRPGAIPVRVASPAQTARFQAEGESGRDAGKTAIPPLTRPGLSPGPVLAGYSVG